LAPGGPTEPLVPFTPLGPCIPGSPLAPCSIPQLESIQVSFLRHDVVIHIEDKTRRVADLCAGSC
jgi:hypothetical protein